MNPARQKTAPMQVRFSTRTSAQAALEDWGRGKALSVNILRGRITQEDASFDIAVTGPARRIQDFIRRSDTRGASVGTSFLVVA